MGVRYSVEYRTVKDSHGLVKCVPETPYRKLPPHRQGTQGALLEQFSAMPKQCYTRSEPPDAYWWTDAQFVPYRDNMVFVTSGAFQPRSNHHWVSVSKIPNGRMIHVSLGSQGLKGWALPDSRMSNYPKIQMHPSGEYIGYIGIDGVKIDTLSHEPVFHKLKNLRNSNYLFCAFSPNGRYLAILASVSQSLEMFVNSTTSGQSSRDDAIDLSKIVKNFRRHGTFNEHLECKWSADSNFIAVCSNINAVFIMDRDLKLVLDITIDVLPDGVVPSWAGTFDYDPRFSHEILAVGGNDRCIYIVNTETKSIEYESEVPISSDAIDTMLYSPSGSLLAVAVRNYSVFLLDTNTLDVSFHIDMKATCPEIDNGPVGFPAVMRLSFSSQGEQLLTSSCDGKVRMWQLPRAAISLFKMCKWAIFSYVPQSKVNQLPLPKMLVDKLLFAV